MPTATAIAPDLASIQQLSQVANAIAQVDRFYGLCAALHLNSQPVILSYGGVWENLAINGMAWYGTMPGCPNRRQTVLDNLFGVFDIADASANCIAPLGAIGQLESEIQNAGGTPTPYQQQTVIEKINILNQWLSSKAISLQSSFQDLEKFGPVGVQQFRDLITQDLAMRAVPPINGAPGDPLLPYYQNVGNQLIQLADACNAPGDALLTGWTAMQGLVGDVAARISAAGSADLGGILQTLDIQSSLTEWPTLCSLAISFRPGPPPPIPATPDGF